MNGLIKPQALKKGDKIASFDDTILFIETSEEKPAPVQLVYWLRNFAAQGILNRVKGILMGRPGGEFKPEEQEKQDDFILSYKAYDEAVLKVLDEFEINIPVVTCMDFGHTLPQFILPYGALAKIDPFEKRVLILEGAVE